MARSFRLLCLALAASWYAAPVLAQPVGFEGIVAYKLSGGGRGAEMTQMYKGSKSRTEIGSGGQGSAMIMDLTTGIMTVLMPQQKAYMVMDMRKAGQAAAGLPFVRDKMAGGAPPTMPKVSATGRTETVAGHTCEYYVMGEKGEAEVCSAKGLGMFMFGQSPMGGAAAGAMGILGTMSGSPDYLKLFKDGFFPLKMIHTEGGKKQVVMEATRVEKKALDASLFVPPPDYKEMKMPGFGR